jgi:hypothetical protein
MTHIIVNESVLSNEDLQMAATETVDRNEMAQGLWAIHINEHGEFDCSFMDRVYRPDYHNAIVSVREWSTPPIGSITVTEMTEEERAENLYWWKAQEESARQDEEEESLFKEKMKLINPHGYPACPECGGYHP